MNEKIEQTAVLSAWTALEALSPQTYKRAEDLAKNDESGIVRLTSEDLPWLKSNEHARPGCQLFYQVILGSISMARATAALQSRFGNDEDEPVQPLREKAIIATVLVDKDGFLVADKSVAVSSFAWALPLALKLKLTEFGRWTLVEQETMQQLAAIIGRVDQNAKPVSLDFATLMEAFRWLMQKFELPEHLFEPPTFALRINQSLKTEESPEHPLLNSFFLRDLVKATALVRDNNAPVGLLRYLGLSEPRETFDLLCNKNELDKAVAPSMVPLTRWPSPGQHPLVLLQQAAVNLARAELVNDEGIVAINGPPGTGKTTLLRDMVAACILDRASAMVAFSDPEKAFIDSGEKVTFGECASFKLFKLDKTLKGHEILVASSNNKAVENISKEMPAARAIGRAVEELNYFKTVSDLLAESANAAGKEETWGLCAAALGNGRNTAAFKEAFWWHADLSFRLYLKAARGDNVTREFKNPETGKPEIRAPKIVQIEKPPTPQQAKTNWKKAKERFENLKREIGAELVALESVRQICHQVYRDRIELEAQEIRLQQMIAHTELLKANLAKCKSDFEAQKIQFEKQTLTLETHRSNGPGFFQTLCRSKEWSAWMVHDAYLTAATSEKFSKLTELQTVITKTNSVIESMVASAGHVRCSIATLRQSVSRLSHTLDSKRQVLKDRLIDEQFFFQSHDRLHLSIPWIQDSLHHKREELFIAALAVHKAFIDASAHRIFHNLSILMEVLSGTPGAARRARLDDLWSTLFLVIPVVSSTFASVERMLSELPMGSIGWLLVDEAGQSLPQAAAGAVMRAKRTVVVGDPLQIPPVTALPMRLCSEICKFFQLDPSVYSAPEASAQTLADRASKFQAAFRSEQGPRRVGIPLLVHRRCQEPMFGISNRIAYDGQMVHAPGSRNTGKVGDALGPSTWFDLDGNADSKWCPAEGEKVVELVQKIAAAGIAKPDLFIITPFKDVADALRQRLLREAQLFASMHIDIRKWAKDRVGTIHTVQGREADTVFLILGAPEASLYRARSWAADTPNILNVAVSRAKQNLYVIGSHNAWSQVGHGRELACIDHSRA